MALTKKHPVTVMAGPARPSKVKRLGTMEILNFCSWSELRGDGGRTSHDVDDGAIAGQAAGEKPIVTFEVEDLKPMDLEIFVDVSD